MKPGRGTNASAVSDGRAITIAGGNGPKKRSTPHRRKTAANMSGIGPFRPMAMSASMAAMEGQADMGSTRSAGSS